MQHAPRIKICGITRKQDAMVAAKLGVDALGFVFYEKSPRFISPADAAIIISTMPPFMTMVGLFVNASLATINHVLAACPLDVLQLHGHESPDFCAIQKRRVIKAVGVSQKSDLEKARQYDCPVLLDAKAPDGIHGGSGQIFDWSLLKRFDHPHPIILAGGLNEYNVQTALEIRQYYAVDVSSGVESAPGIKDAEKMHRFVKRVREFKPQGEHF